VEMRVTAEAFMDIHTAVNTLETNIIMPAAHSVLLGEGTTAPGSATIGTVGRVLTDMGSGVDPVFLAPVTATTVSAALASSYSMTTSFANVGLSITLPAAGTYLIAGFARFNLTFAPVATGPGNGAYSSLRLWDGTNSVTVPNSTSIGMLINCQVASVAENFQQTCPIGPVLYTVSSAVLLQLQAFGSVQSGGTLSNATIYTDANGGTALSAVRVA
jgi:hypothetical protein